MSGTLPSGSGPVSGEDLLLTGSPTEILARIVPGDPLGVRERVARRLRERALFLDLERACLRTFAHVASGAITWRGDPGLAIFLSKRIDAALNELLALERDPPLDDDVPSSDTARQLALPLGLDPLVLREACVRFHALPHNVRDAFFHVVVEGHAPEKFRIPAPSSASPYESGEPSSPVLERARHALRVLTRDNACSSPSLDPPHLPAE